jgi:hypothetical protein
LLLHFVRIQNTKKRICIHDCIELHQCARLGSKFNWVRMFSVSNSHLVIGDESIQNVKWINSTRVIYYRDKIMENLIWECDPVVENIMMEGSAQVRIIILSHINLPGILRT